MLRPRLSLRFAAACFGACLVVGPAWAQQQAPTPARVLTAQREALLSWDPDGQTREVDLGALGRQVVASRSGAAVLVSTDESVLRVVPGAPQPVERLDLTAGISETEALVQAIGVTLDQQRLYVVYQLETLERAGGFTGPLTVKGFLLGEDLALGEAVWTAIVPDERHVIAIVCGASGDDPLLLVHDREPAALTRLDPSRDAIRDPAAVKLQLLTRLAGARWSPRARGCWPGRTPGGQMALPVARADGGGALLIYDLAEAKARLLAYQGPPAQCVVISRKGDLAWLGLDFVRLVELPSGQPRASVQFRPQVYAMALSADERLLYLNRGQRLTVLDAHSLKVEDELPLRPFGRGLALAGAP